MIRKLDLSRALFALVPLLMISSIGQAAGFSRVFVAAKSGNDANACNSVATPCQTFAGAITQVAAGGEIIVLESGGYGPVTINKGVTIEAPTGIVAFVHPPSGTAIVVDAGFTDTVILRGLTLNGGDADGIFASAVGQLFVEHCTISGFVFNGINFEAQSGVLVMTDDDVRNCTNAGVLVSSASTTIVRAVLTNSTIVGNGIGVFAADGGVVSVTNCVASHNQQGFMTKTQSAVDAEMTLDRAQAAFNDTGIYAVSTSSGAATIRLVNSFITKNSTGVWSDTGGIVLGSSPGTNVVSGNYSANITGTLGTAMTLK